MLNFKRSNFASPLGNLSITHDGTVLYALEFLQPSTRVSARLKRRYEPCRFDPVPTPLPIHHSLTAYFDGELGAISSIAIQLEGTPFQNAVWTQLRLIPAGQTASYHALACAIQRPTANRAVAMANHFNPIALIVPCHRVIRLSGALSGYGGGIPHKRWLLRHENAISPQGQW